MMKSHFKLKEVEQKIRNGEIIVQRDTLLIATPMSVKNVDRFPYTWNMMS